MIYVVNIWFIIEIVNYEVRGCDTMTLQQQVCARIINMSDEGAAFINQVINNMNPVFLIGKNSTKFDMETVDVSKRIGIGKGLIEDPEDFDKWNDEIAGLFEGVTKWTI